MQKKRDFRSLWIVRISAACEEGGISYSRFIHGLNSIGVKVNRKMLADMAYKKPEEFNQMVKSIREVEKALGKVTYDLTEKQKKSRELSRSLFVVKDIKNGEVFTEDNVRSIRPGYGLEPKYLKEVLEKRARRDLEKGTPVKMELVEE